MFRIHSSVVSKHETCPHFHSIQATALNQRKIKPEEKYLEESCRIYTIVHRGLGGF
jgi:hypothetical protein